MYVCIYDVIPGYNQSPCGSLALTVTVPYVNAKPLVVILPLTMGGRMSAPPACFMQASAEDVHLKRVDRKMKAWLCLQVAH